MSTESTTSRIMKERNIDPHEVKEGLGKGFDIYRDTKGNLFALKKGAPESTAQSLGRNLPK